MGIKTIETRRWQTSHRGVIFIHASQRKAGAVIAAEPPIARHIPDFNKLPFGCIIGQATLTDIVLQENLQLSKTDIASQSLELQAFGGEALNRYAWLLEDAFAFDQPVPARGHLHLWKYQGRSQTAENRK